jgi:hypothetical protein
MLTGLEVLPVDRFGREVLVALDFAGTVAPARTTPSQVACSLESRSLCLPALAPAGVLVAAEERENAGVSVEHKRKPAEVERQATRTLEGYAAKVYPGPGRVGRPNRRIGDGLS